MHGRTSKERDEQAATYLGQLQELAYEINIAMGAIATNALAVLQESVAKQETLCHSLAIMAEAASDSLDPVESNLLEPALVVVDDRVQITIDLIRNLNLQYSSLLKHSGRSIAILSSLCRSHTGQFNDLGGTILKRQTWSCEV